MDIKDFIITDGAKLKLADMPTSLGIDKDRRPKVEAMQAENESDIADLQERFYADSREGLVMLLQAMDAAGKDSTIKRAMKGINPQGVKVTSFKQPSKEELAHDYLWRVIRALPERGQIGIFNRSYYEDVLVVKVHDLQKGYRMPERVIGVDSEKFFARRYEQIRGFEQYLYENGYRFLKIFLHVSKDKQRERFIERIDQEEKNWKFSSSDVAERAFWDDYQDAYEKAIRATATKECPWYVIPADQKWVTRYLVSEALKGVLESCHSEYPVLPDEERAKLAAAKEQLLAE
ncbi:MAG: PPK2 family polyphosphate kinase [Coriobacteriales bacterium]|jgi:PPK2 family polyphosphate:nucleotide phosphotransferase